MKAVIIAAGTGSRLKIKHNGFPKTLLHVSNKRIIDIILNGIIYSGITEVVIVTGYKSYVLEEYLQNNTPGSLNIEYCYNPNWALSNGISVLAAENFIGLNDQFVLLMSDHIFDPDMLKNMLATHINKNQALLAIDFKISTIPDLDDGMKVKCFQSQNSKIHSITKLDKSFDVFQAIDCGMFKLNHNFFDTLRYSISLGNTSLSDACNSLAADGLMLGLDIKDKHWIDLDTPEMFLFTSIIEEILSK